ncbi:MAG: DEAD/DEAH box helicase, partial [candidate division Zixibacteria bacterium]|nr:DEAD/DEAH box helicase [candidate division Zixibacteria bacterium]
AKELLEIYAKRETTPGRAFKPDTEWQAEIEDSFPYVETDDQLHAIADVKTDMEKSRPMDRLVCGDVGYGKTEVALRAAFKTVDSGKQVAVVAPTTILAQQHFETFKERMENFPVKIEMLSRFVERRKQKKIIAALKTGEVDMVIGTHRLLSKDIEFKDIGLLIVDEEQRFGVAHKEKLKRWRTVVDVLTLTATPIPRTMQLSLFGARDMTIINTPPKDRRPIITEVAQFSDKSISEPILREIDRGGQVYFVHNRIESIDAIARYLYKILPNVTFNVAHGQMNEKQLEDIMYRFSKGKFQCLISTTIIESGLDIPSVNTIIINRADKLGLAQLYQLRGRVGRSDRQAYAYFLIPPYRLLTTTARRRLKAMEEFTALGSGFNLALRDLEIRGAGNFLGPQQHGFIEEIGFDLYCRLLDEAVAELKGEEAPEDVDTKLTIDCDLYVPDSYIEEKDLRVDLYRRLADSKDYGEVDSILEDTRDRFGEPPDTVFNLFLMSRIRIASNKLGLDRITIKGERIFAEFPEGAKLTKRIVEGFVKSISERIHFYTTDAFQMEILLQGLREKKGLQAVVDIMQRLEHSFTSEKELKDEEKINQ